MRKINIEELIGKKFNRLTIISLDHNKYYYNDGRIRSTQRYIKCKCDCGNEKILPLYGVIYNKVKSCGCLKTELLIKDKTTHGMTNTRIYRIYWDIKKRCLNNKNVDYHNYGGRGIKICDDWLDKKNGFMNFYNWSINNGYKENLTIDRIDNSGNYSPENCRWASQTEQANNRRDNILYLYNNKSMTLTDICRGLGLKYDKIRYRILFMGYSLMQAIEFENINNSKKAIKLTQGGTLI